MTLPYDAVRKTRDRSWTHRLLAALASAPGDDEMGEITWTLAALDDPRSFAPLLALLADPRAPAAAREAAGSVLRDVAAPETRSTRRSFWRSGDPILEAHALARMDRADAELIEPVAADPAHPLHAQAIRSLCWGFEEPRFQRLKIRALGHPDPAVRAAACDTLLWDEPVAAEDGLLHAASDPVEKVAVAALNTLRYYTTRRTLAALHALRSSPRERIRSEADDSFNEVQGSFWSALERADGPEAERLRAWMAPVWTLVAYEPEPEPDPAAPAASPPPAPAPYRPSASEIEAEYGDLDGPWADKAQQFFRIDWASYGADDRARLVPFFTRHEDPSLRQSACQALGAWGAQDVLLGLLGDPSFLVRKSAMYWLGKTRPASARVAERAWTHLHAPATESTHAYETLETYIQHGARDEVIPRLVRLVRHDERQAVRTHAAHALDHLGALDELKSLFDLLEDEPGVTWSLHIALLSGASELPPQARPLLGVDDLWLQAELARFDR